MRPLRLFTASAAALLFASSASLAGGGSPSGNIVAAASASPDFSTLVAAVKAAKLVDTLASKGPFTVFAPTNDAFAKIDSATLQNLLKPENRDQLTKVLTYHVVAGRLNAADIVQQIQAGGGQAMLTTVEGSQLTARLQGANVILVDENNRTSAVTKTDLMQSNGVIHVIDTVVLPG
jgi:uncharacterized surface protein with fasciclin (FAS1) repeats